jgi:hypothetical protein
MLRRRLLWLAFAPLACGDITSEVAIGFERPRDDAPLGEVDNITVTLSPDGFTDQFAVDGPDSSVEIELPPDDTSRSLSVFFARGESLIAYGRTPRFTFGGAAGAGVKVFLGYPGTVATLDRDFALPDASTVVAGSPGRGAVALGSDGAAAFLDAYTFDLVSMAPFPEPVPAAGDGLFVGDPSGSVTRIAADEGLTATRYRYGADRWDHVSYEDMTPRPGASMWFDAETSTAYVAGGGETSSLLEVQVVTEDTDLPVFVPLEPALDGPRPRGTLFGRRGEGISGLVVFGGSDASLPLARAIEAGADADDVGTAWTDASCVALDDTRTLCAGGIVDGETTADAAIVELASGSPAVSRLPEQLPVPMRDVLWLEDELAVYAQGEGRLVRIDRVSLEATEPAGSPQRATGGGAAILPTGVTLIAGGEAADGSATDVWQLFSPAISPG